MLVDCGMFQGSPEEVSRNRIPFAFEAGRARRAAAHARAPGPLRPHPGPGAGGLPRADLHHRRPRPTWPRSSCATRPSCRARLKPDGAASIRTRRLPPTPTCSPKRLRPRAPPKDDEALPERIRKAAAAGHDHDPGRALRRARRGPDRPPVPRRALRRDDRGRARRARHLPRRGAHPGLGHHRAAGHRRRRDHHGRLLRRPRAQPHPDRGRPHAAHPRRLRAGRVDLRQP